MTLELIIFLEIDDIFIEFLKEIRIKLIEYSNNNLKRVVNRNYPDISLRLYGIDFEFEILQKRIQYCQTIFKKINVDVKKNITPGWSVTFPNFDFKIALDIIENNPQYFSHIPKRDTNTDYITKSMEDKYSHIGSEYGFFDAEK